LRATLRARLSPSPAATASSPLSLHDALPIFQQRRMELTSPWPTADLQESGDQLVRIGQRADAQPLLEGGDGHALGWLGDVRPVSDRKSTRLNSSHVKISYAVFCLKKKNTDGH